MSPFVAPTWRGGGTELSRAKRGRLYRTSGAEYARFPVFAKYRDFNIPGCSSQRGLATQNILGSHSILTTNRGSSTIIDELWELRGANAVHTFECAIGTGRSRMVPGRSEGPVSSERVGERLQDETRKKTSPRLTPQKCLIGKVVLCVLTLEHCPRLVVWNCIIKNVGPQFPGYMRVAPRQSDPFQLSIYPPTAGAGSNAANLIFCQLLSVALQ